MNIRKFLRIDKEVLEFDSTLVDATGLIIVEKKDFMKPKQQGCFGYVYDISSATHPANCQNHAPCDLHLSHPLHIG